MQTSIHWGNLFKFGDEISVNNNYTEHIQQIIYKNSSKIDRILKPLEQSSIRLEFNFQFLPHTKQFKVALILHTPKSYLHVSENGFSLEEAIKRSVLSLRRRFRENKEKKISLKRKSSIRTI